MSEIIVAFIFFFLAIIFVGLMQERQRKKDHQMKLESGISYEISCARDLRAQKTDKALSMIEHKIYDHLLFTMEITKKGDKQRSLLDFNKTTPGIIESWQQGKGIF